MRRFTVCQEVTLSSQRFAQILIVMVTLGIASWAFAAQPEAGLLLMPIVPDPEVSLDDAEQIDQILGKRMKKFKKFDISTIDDYTDKFGRKRARSMMRCGDDVKCLDRYLRRAPYDLVVVGRAGFEGNGRLTVRFQVYNLAEGEVVRRKEFKLNAGTFSDKKHARKWTLALLVPVEDLLGESDVIEPEPEPTPAPVAAPVRRRPDLASAEDVKDGIRTAYMYFADGNINGAVGKIQQVVKRRCGCDEDGRAYGMKAMLEAFRVAHDRVATAMQRSDSKTIIGNLEEMKTLEGELSEEGHKLNVKGESRYAKDMGRAFAKGYILQGQGQLKATQYLDARDSFNKALEYDSNAVEAKEQLDKMPRYANQLLMQGTFMVDYAPEEALKKLRMVQEMVGEGDPLYAKAQEKINEIEEMD